MRINYKYLCDVRHQFEIIRFLTQRKETSQNLSLGEGGRLMIFDDVVEMEGNSVKRREKQQ